LSLQALWEKQLRGYLCQCVIYLKRDPVVSRQIEKANWENLNALFKDLRGISLTDFVEYPLLNQLHLLGNVCRHGPGDSVHRLASIHPELWVPDPEPAFPVPLPPRPRVEFVRAAENIRVDLPRLQLLAAAIDSFWSETVYIYNESIGGKDDSLERFLIPERHKRAGRGCPWDPPK